MERGSRDDDRQLAAGHHGRPPCSILGADAPSAPQSPSGLCASGSTPGAGDVGRGGYPGRPGARSPSQTHARSLTISVMGAVRNGVGLTRGHDQRRAPVPIPRAPRRRRARSHRRAPEGPPAAAETLGRRRRSSSAPYRPNTEAWRDQLPRVPRRLPDRRAPRGRLRRRPRRPRPRAAPGLRPRLKPVEGSI